MNTTLNINNCDHDIFYRYKMPPITTKLERGNTVLTNIDQVSKALMKPTSYLVRFFNIELGTRYIEKHDKKMLRGSVDSNTLQKCLVKFINMFVLCLNCGNPETEIKQNAFLECKSCGSSVKLHNHKLLKFILKTVKELPTVKEPPTVKKPPITKEPPTVKMSPITKELPTVKEPPITKAMQTKKNMDEFYYFVQREKDKNKIYMEASKLNVISKAQLILIEVLFDENIILQIEQYSQLFIMFGETKYIFSGMEKYFQIYPTMMRKVVQIFYTLYHYDILSEDTIMQWWSNNKQPTQSIKNNLKPFIDWLTKN